MGEVKGLVVTLVQRLKVDHSRSQDEEEFLEAKQGSTDYERGWAAGFTKGLDHALSLVEDFLGRFIR